MIQSKVRKVYLISEPGGERGEINEWREIPEGELRDYDYPLWADYQRQRKMPEETINWENFIAWWCEENVAYVEIVEEELLSCDYDERLRDDF